MEIKTCCVTGHRNIPADKIDYVKQELRREVLAAVQDGYTRFISGFAEGVDLMFAAIVAELKQENDSLWLEAAIPYRKRVSSPDPVFNELLGQCKSIGVYSEEYSPSCFMRRNRIMVSESQRVIGVYDGREHGGTAGTLRFAGSQEKEVRIIKI